MPNPAGTNSPVAFDQFTRQIPYGEKKIQGDLQRSVPLAGASAAATPLNAPRRAAASAKRTPRPSAPAAAAATEAPAPLREPAPPPNLAAVWAQLASVPGASPLIQDYAARAAQQ